jgi:hypothetical protein
MKWNRDIFYRLTLLALVVLPLALISYKIFVLHYPLAALLPSVGYRVDLSLQVDGHGGDVSVATFLPRSDHRQLIGEGQSASGPFLFSLQTEGENLVANWTAANLRGPHNILYTFTVSPRHVRYLLPAGLKTPAFYPAAFTSYLETTPGIQVSDPLIEAALQEILPAELPDITTTLTAIHRYLQDQIENRDFSGYTDAVTALKLGEASCNGKSRLFAAFARKLHLPARLVGGVILEQRSKRTTHQWVEIYVNGHWVPFDTVNDHFAELPANFLTLYYGDLVMFQHTPNINFRSLYKMTRTLGPPPELQDSLARSPLTILNLFGLFEQVGISRKLLEIILMLPFGALVTAVLRNVVGLETFGTFLPALIAAAALETGLWWGIIGFLIIILLGAAAQRGLDGLQILHAPAMAILFATVIILMLAMTVVGLKLGLIALAHITLFPVAILTLTAERFAQVQAEHSFAAAARRLLMTVLAVAVCYAVMHSAVLKSLVLVFPECLLLIIAFDLWLGKWVGIRLAEFIRFRRLLQKEAP